MRKGLLISGRTGWAVLAATLCMLALAGCLEKRLSWAPDGSRAAVITKDGLYLCDRAGNLSGLLVPGAYQAAWTSDSRHIVLARSRDVMDSPSLTAALGRNRADVIAIKAEATWQQLAQGRTLDEVADDEGADAVAEVIFLRERHSDDLHRLLGKQWDDIRDQPATLHSLALASVDDDGRISVSAVICEDLSPIKDIRLSPDGSAVAYSCFFKAHSDSDFQIFLAPLDAGQKPVVVASHTNAYPDWTADGKAIEYLQSNGSGVGDNPMLGTLTRRTVFGPRFRIAIAKAATDQVGLVFQSQDRIRCLKDGRILFSAAEFQLPRVKTDNMDRELLFSFRGGSSPSLVPLISRQGMEKLSSALAAFEVSPDESQVLLAGDKGDACILTLRTGEIETIAPSIGTKENLFEPVWRRPGEVTFARQVKLGAGKSGRSVEVILRSGANEEVLSRNWPNEVMDKFLY